MKKSTVEIGRTYALRSKTGGDVQDANGDVIKTLEPGKQQHETAQESEWLVPDDCQVTKTNFKRALAALGLLGGGANSTLPDGYLQAYFLESNGEAYIEFPFEFYGSAGAAVVETRILFNSNNSYSLEGTERMGWGVYGKRSCLAQVGSGFAAGEFKTGVWAVRKTKFAGATVTNYATNGELREKEVGIAYSSILQLWRTYNTDFVFPCKRQTFSIRVNGVKKIDFTSAISGTGEPCLYERVSKSVYKNIGSGSFIVGFTRAQARKLGKLPPGSSFTVSLPEGWQEEAGVVEALAQAETNGCVLPVQEYSEEASAAATYALRRIWVRRTPDALGNYVDVDGTRWLVEWCVDVIGADPETLGYERFRSVEVACDYWGLVPYVAPEEELLTEA